MPKFYCYNCGQHIDADESLAGKVATCPSCQIELNVPGAVSGSSASQRKRGKLFPRPTAHDKPVQDQNRNSEHTFPSIKPQLEIVPFFKSRVSVWGLMIISIPDELTKVCLLSYFYYLEEFSYGGRNTWFVPERFLSGDILGNMEQYIKSRDVFFNAEEVIIRDISCYYYMKQESSLKNLRELAPELLYHFNYPIVFGLELYV